MKVLPQASAIGNIHIGTIAGKLNGVMPAHTPSGWRIDQVSMPRPTVSVNSPLSRCGMPQANSTTSRPRMIEPLRVGQDLAVLAGDHLRQLVDVLLDQLLEPEQDARALQRRRRRPAGMGGLGRGDRRLPTSAVDASGTLAATSPVAGLKTSPKRSAGAVDALAVDVVMQGLGHLSFPLWACCARL